MSWIKECEAAWSASDLSQCEPMGMPLEFWVSLGLPILGVLGWIFRHSIRATVKKFLSGRSKPPTAIHKIDSDLIGREIAHAALDNHFTINKAPYIIHGAPGIGKTVLARDYGKRHKGERYADWIMLTLNSASGMKVELEMLAAQLGVDPKLGEKAYIQTAFQKMQESGHRYLIILDNADADAQCRLAQDFACDMDNVDFIITSQQKDWPDGYAVNTLGPLKPEDATELLSELSEREIDEELQSFSKTLDYLPLALDVVGRDLKLYAGSLGDYITEYKSFKVPDVFNKEGGNKRYEKSVVKAVLMAFDRLDDEAKAILKIAAFMDPNDIDAGFFMRGAAGLKAKGLDALPEPLNTICNSEMKLTRALAACENHSLLYPAIWRDNDTRRIHRTTQAALRQAMGADEAVYAGVTGRLGAAQVSGDAQFDSDNWPAYHRLAPHAEALTSAVDIMSGKTGILASFWLNKMGVFLSNATGDHKRTMTLGQHEVELYERLHGPKSSEYLTALHNMTVTKDKLARTETGAAREALDAEIEQAFNHIITLKTALPNEELSIADTHIGLAEFYRARRRLKEAETHFLKALKLRQDNDAPMHVIASALGNIGVLYSDWARHEEDSERQQDLLGKASNYNADALLKTRQALGEIHLSTAVRLNNLRVQFNDKGDFKEGIFYAARACAVLKLMVQTNQIPKNHPYVTQFSQGLALTLTRLKRDPAEASALIDAAILQIRANQEIWEAAKEAGTLESYVPPPITPMDED
ncbi:AAA family ATPase [Fretibacter rubidus]|uniref:AAA family ATPase n=1 Tax=Fretibacter rubidus TaxID=570162 RepID=UPI00352AFB48